MNLTYLARKTLEAHFNNEKFEPDEETKQTYKKEQACFVTLTKNGDLRGCIGSLQAYQQLWKDVQSNAINAAFHDPRFPGLSKDELNEIKIEISILSEPKKLEFKDESDLLNKINNKMGLILKKGFASSTFLPQVWEQIPDKRRFLENLAIKAGLNKNDWKNADFLYYAVEKEEE